MNIFDGLKRIGHSILESIPGLVTTEHEVGHGAGTKPHAKTRQPDLTKDLPKDILSRVGDYLTIEELMRLRLVNKALKEVVEGDPYRAGEASRRTGIRLTPEDLKPENAEKLNEILIFAKNLGLSIKIDLKTRQDVLAFIESINKQKTGDIGALLKLIQTIISISSATYGKVGYGKGWIHDSGILPKDVVEAEELQAILNFAKAHKLPLKIDLYTRLDREAFIDLVGAQEDSKAFLDLIQTEIPLSPIELTDPENIGLVFANENKLKLKVTLNTTEDVKLFKELIEDPKSAPYLSLFATISIEGNINNGETQALFDTLENKADQLTSLTTLSTYKCYKSERFPVLSSLIHFVFRLFSVWL